MASRLHYALAMLHMAQVFVVAGLMVVAAISSVLTAQRPAARITIQGVETRPRLFFAPGEFSRFVDETTGARAEFFNSLLAEVEQRGSRAWNERNLQLESQALVARVLLDRGDARGNAILALARNSLRYYLDRHTYTEYRDSHDVVTAGSRWLEAVSLAYDWAYPNWTSAERTAMADWLRDEIDRWVDSDQISRASPSPFRNDLARGVAGLVGAGLTLFDEPGYREVATKGLNYALGFYDEVLEAHKYAGGDGGMPEGTFYGAFTAWSQVMVAEMLYTGAGIRDIYQRSPFFEQRLRYAIHAAWPGYITNESRHNTHQLAPVFGDARRGPTGSALQHRATVLLLGKRLASSDAARQAYAIVNRDETGRTYTREWRLYDLLLWSPRVRRQTPIALAYRERTLGQVFARSDWSDEATWLSFNAGPHLDTHQHYDAGNLTIYRNGVDLLVDSGSLDGFGSKHWYNYYARTVAHNTVLIHDPEERWEGIWSGVPDNLAVNDGGQRTAAPLTPAPTLRQYLDNQVAYDHGSVERYDSARWGLYIKSNLTNAYQNPKYQSAKPNRSRNRVKAEHVGREVVYLRRDARRRDAVVVFDRVVAADQSFRKAVLWHARDPFSTSAAGRRVDEGERVHDVSAPITFQTTSTFRQGANQGSSRLYVTVVPIDRVRVRQIGARPSTGNQPDHETFSTKHFHRHLKDFFVEDSRVSNPDTDTGARNRQEWPPFAPPEVQWLWNDDLAGGWGSTRLQVEPADASAANRFLTLLVPTDADDREQPRVDAVLSPDRSAAGLAWTERDRQIVVVFGMEHHGGDLQRALVEVPAGTPGELYFVGLKPNTGYRVSSSGSSPRQITIAVGGTLDSGEQGVLRLDLQRLQSVAAAQVASAPSTASRQAAAGSVAAPAIEADGPGAVTTVIATSPSDLERWTAWVEQRKADGRFALRSRTSDALVPGRTVERFEQRIAGLPVMGRDLVVERAGDRTSAIFGSVTDLRVDRARAQLSPDQARRSIEAAADIDLPRDRQPRLVLLPQTDGTAERAYCDRVMTRDGPRTVCVGASDGTLLATVDETRTQRQEAEAAAAPQVFRVADDDSIVGYVNGVVPLSRRDRAGLEPGSTGEAIAKQQSALVRAWTSRYGVDLTGAPPIVAIVRPSAGPAGTDAAYLGRGVVIFADGEGTARINAGRVAHELAHVLIDRSSRLQPTGESAELEEDFAAVMAELSGAAPAAGGTMKRLFQQSSDRMVNDRLRLERAFVRAFTRLLPSAATVELARAAVVSAYEALGGSTAELRAAWGEKP